MKIEVAPNYRKVPFGDLNVGDVFCELQRKGQPWQMKTSYYGGYNSVYLSGAHLSYVDKDFYVSVPEEAVVVIR